MSERTHFIRVTTGPQGSLAECRCGWVAEYRMDSETAEADAAQHGASVDSAPTPSAGTARPDAAPSEMALSHEGVEHARRFALEGWGATCTQTLSLCATIDALRSVLAERDAECERLRGVCHKLDDALAKRCLADANREAEGTNDWPGQMQWDELVGTSQSIMRHRAWQEAGLDVPATIALLFDEYGWPKAYDESPASAAVAPAARETQETTDDN